MVKNYVNEYIFSNLIDIEEKIAIINKNTLYSYEWLFENIKNCENYLELGKIQRGDVVALCGDFTPNSISLLLALINKSCIIVPLSNSSQIDITNYIHIASVHFIIDIAEDDSYTIKNISHRILNEYYETIIKRETPGLVLFSSGTSGKPKAAVHDFSKLLEKFKAKRSALRTLNFLMFDHWGGLNTLFHILSNGGTVIATIDRTPKNICKLIQDYQIELLPASPTFLNLLILSSAYENYNLESLKIISYGTEPMLLSTLGRLKKIFPEVKFRQTYGLIELGVLRSQSKNDESLWVKIGGEGYKLRVVDGLLEIKAESAMLGYLNAPSPFTEDGWFKTGDAVEVEGEYYKILGRKSELLNIGGEKVYPQEIESVILEVENVTDVIVYGEKNSITGNTICAKVKLIVQEDRKELIKKIKNHCSEKLARYKVPSKIIISENNFHSERFKKNRNGQHEQ